MAKRGAGPACRSAWPVAQRLPCTDRASHPEWYVWTVGKPCGSSLTLRRGSWTGRTEFEERVLRRQQLHASQPPCRATADGDGFALRWCASGGEVKFFARFGQGY